MNFFSNNLKLLRKSRGYTQGFLADALKVKINTISNYENGVSEPSYDLLRKLVEAFQVPAHDFLFKNLEIRQGVTKEELNIPAEIAKEESIVEYGRRAGVPYYDDIPVSAGDFTAFLDTTKPVSYLNIPQISDCVAILPIHGSSMKGVVEPGDLVAIKEIHSRNEFDPSVPYVIITDEHRMVKYLRVDESDESIVWAESTNHARIKLQVANIKKVYAIKCVIRFI